MSIALALAARSTRAGALAAWVDPGDRFDPGSAAAAGVDLARLLWLRGDVFRERVLTESVAAAGTLLGSRLFELVVLDLAGVPSQDLRRLPHTTWWRLQREIQHAPIALVVLSAVHTTQGPGGVSLELKPAQACWAGLGPGRLLVSMHTEAAAGRFERRSTWLERRACS